MFKFFSSFSKTTQPPQNAWPQEISATPDSTENVRSGAKKDDVQTRHFPNAGKNTWTSLIPDSRNNVIQQPPRALIKDGKAPVHYGRGQAATLEATLKELHINNLICDFAIKNSGDELSKYFESFIHAKDDSEKAEIAKSVAGEQERLFHAIWKPDPLSSAVTPVNSLCSHFAFASMISHHLLSEKKEGSLSDPKNYSNQTSEYCPWIQYTPRIIENIYSSLLECIYAVASPYSGEMEARYLKQKEDVQALLVDINKRAMTLLARFTSQEVVEQLCKGESDETCTTAMRNWAKHYRNSLREKYTFEVGAGSRNNDLDLIKSQLVEHCRKELAATEHASEYESRKNG